MAVISGKPLAIDLFCGSGSVTAAMKKAGYTVVRAVDFDPMAAETYRANHPDVELLEEDIRELQPKRLSKGIRRGKLALLAICAPCQPFSSQNRKRSNDDPRADLLSCALPFVEKLRPKTVWIENVPGLASSGRMAGVTEKLQRLGYTVSTPTKVDAADLGVPQRRVRCVVIASRVRGLPEVFEKLVSRRTRKRLSVRDAFHELEPLGPGEKDEGDQLHSSRRHSPITLRRLSHIPKNGGSRAALPEDLQLACHRGLPANSFPDVYGRMSWDHPAPTLTTGCTDLTRGRFAHPEQDRAITLREAARLQTFPDTYIFKGNQSQIATQIGNAVPMKMAQTMFRVIRRASR